MQTSKLKKETEKDKEEKGIKDIKESVNVNWIWRTETTNSYIYMAREK
jgi:hypothetical protein